jgi:hypothetical protein
VELGNELLNRRALDKGADERVFTHYQPKGKKRNVKEYLKSGEQEERFLGSKFVINDSYPPTPQVVEKPTELEHRPLPPADKKYVYLYRF